MSTREMKEWCRAKEDIPGFEASAKEGGEQVERAFEVVARLAEAQQEGEVGEVGLEGEVWGLGGIEEEKRGCC